MSLAEVKTTLTMSGRRMRELRDTRAAEERLFLEAGKRYASFGKELDIALDEIAMGNKIALELMETLKMQVAASVHMQEGTVHSYDDVVPRNFEYWAKSPELIVLSKSRKQHDFVQKAMTGDFTIDKHTHTFATKLGESYWALIPDSGTAMRAFAQGAASICFDDPDELDIVSQYEISPDKNHFVRGVGFGMLVNFWVSNQVPKSVSILTTSMRINVAQLRGRSPNETVLCGTEKFTQKLWDCMDEPWATLFFTLDSRMFQHSDMICLKTKGISTKKAIANIFETYAEKTYLTKGSRRFIEYIFAR